MSQDTYKFEINEVFKKRWPYLLIGLTAFWAIFTILYFVDNKITPLWIFYIIPGAYTFLAVINYIYYYRDFYEISNATIKLKRGDKTLRSIKCDDVIGFKSNLPIRLKLTNQKYFVFKGIVIKSSREKLLSVLRQIGLSEIPKPPKFTLLQLIILVGAILSISHFLGSLVFWGVGIFSHYIFNNANIDWFMFLHSIPAFVLFGTSILSLVLVIKRNRKAGPVLLLTIVLAVSCSVFEISNHCYNGFGKREYFTWWWYDLFGPKREESPRVECKYKYGFINKSGDIVIKPQFDTVGNFSEGMAKIGYRYEIDPNEIPKNPFPGMPSFFADTMKYSFKYGYINKEGDIHIEPVFDNADDFSEDLACIAVVDDEYSYKYGYINKEGVVVIEPQFDCAWPFHEDRAKIELEDNDGYIDKTGKVIVDPQFPRAKDFSEGLAAVKIEDKYGYINKLGEMIIQPQFDYAESFSEGLAMVNIGEKYGYIDKAGQIVIKPKYNRSMKFSEGLAAISMNRRGSCVYHFGYIDKDGLIVTEPKYSFAINFREGVAGVCTEQGWGYRHKAIWQCIDKEGKVIKKPYFDKVRFFNEGISKVWIDGKWGYIDKNGIMIIEPQFDSADHFFEGMASIGMGIKKD